MNKPGAHEITSSPQGPLAPESIAGEGDDKIIGQAFGISLAVILVAGVVVAGLVYYLNRKPADTVQNVPGSKPPELRKESRLVMPTVKFVDVTESAGITFVHENGATGDKLLPETMGGGCAMFDFDNDGDQDILLVNSNYWPWNDAAKDKPAPVTALYRNDGNWKFTDVAKEAGLAVTMYGMGAAVGDFDNDTWVDVYLTGVGGNRLFKNNAGKFEDVTEAAGVAGGGGWGTSAGFVDMDNDGDLDLVACNYVRWSREIDQAQDFRLTGLGRAYGPPLAFDGTYPNLFRNEGDGKFKDVSEEAGLHVKNPATNVPMAKALGLAPVDIDRDGWMDLIVANDTVQNLVFRNKHDGKFEEIGAESGIAFDTSGNSRGAMGVDAARFRNDGSLGVMIGNFTNEMTSLFVSQSAPLMFIDEANSTGLGPASRLMLKFGVFFFDYDLDGRLDAFMANGHLEEEINKVQSSQQYAQPPQLYWNCGPEEETEFRPVLEANCGKDFVRPIVGRGASYADLDGDGDLDIVICSIRSAPRLLRNDQSLGHHWLRFKLVGKKSNRDAIGAWVEVTTGPHTQWRQVMPTRSYLSQSELPVTFGIGKADKVDSVVVHWPHGEKQEVKDVKLDTLTTVEQLP